MNFKSVLFSRGLIALVAMFIVLDVLGFFIVKGFASFAFVFILEILMVLFYVIIRSLIDVDQPVWFLKDRNDV